MLQKIKCEILLLVIEYYRWEVGCSFFSCLFLCIGRLFLVIIVVYRVMWMEVYEFVVFVPVSSDHDFIEEQERHLYSTCIRTMALPVGRGIFAMCTYHPVPTETLPVPPLCTTGRAPPRYGAIRHRFTLVSNSGSLTPVSLCLLSLYLCLLSLFYSLSLSLSYLSLYLLSISISLLSPISLQHNLTLTPTLSLIRISFQGYDKIMFIYAQYFFL